MASGENIHLTYKHTSEYMITNYVKGTEKNLQFSEVKECCIFELLVKADS
jgi:hypothetical protein